jgi:hypothetical protein
MKSLKFEVIKKLKFFKITRSIATKKLFPLLPIQKPL